MEVHKHFSLLEYNTFGIDVKAEAFAKIHSVSDLQTALHTNIRPLNILGGGSNILFTKNVKGLVLKNEIPGIKIVKEEGEKVWVEAGGGVVWHDFVLWCLDKNLGGVENLSLIPGSVGAAPIQNIGAYGVELKDVFEYLEAVSLEDGSVKTFSKKECAFGYRDSIFKKELKGTFFITKVCFRLSKKPKIHISYGAIRQTLEEAGIHHPDIRDVSRAVIQIRKSKLPDPRELGNAGSFFKNPEIDQAHFESLFRKYPDIIHYPLPGGKVKIPAGWLIEQCGWKGKRIGNAGSHARQALVLVNYGGARGEDIQRLSEEITASVEEKFQIHLFREVNIW